MDRKGFTTEHPDMTYSCYASEGIGTRSSPLSRGNRPLLNGGASSREKVSRIGILSIVLVLYSGITVCLILWNQSGSSQAVFNSDAPGGTSPDKVEGKLDGVGRRATSQSADIGLPRGARSGEDGGGLISRDTGGQTVGTSFDGMAPGEIGGEVGGGIGYRTDNKEVRVVLLKQGGGSNATTYGSS